MLFLLHEDCFKFKEGVRRIGKNWMATISFSGRSFILGSFTTKDEARKKYGSTVLKLLDEKYEGNGRNIEENCEEKFSDLANIDRKIGTPCKNFRGKTGNPSWGLLNLQPK